MELNELMIGDLVSYKGKMLCKITAICKDTAVVDNDTKQDWRIDYNKLMPIPLTDEILKKNFNFDPNNSEGAFEHYWWSNGCLDVAITEYSDGIWEIEIDEIEMGGLPTWKMYATHVHELQHALRLCNIEKEIEL